MKHQKEIELFQKIILKVPIIEKCDYVKSIEKEVVFKIQMEDGNSFDVILHIMKAGYPKQIQILFEQISEKGYHIVAAPFISESSEKICRNQNVGYIDAAGNCFIQYHSIYINITGYKNDAVSKRALKSIFERSSIVSSKILRIMFSDVNKYWKLKELAETAECSIGQVSKVKDFLLNHAWIEQTKDGIYIVNAEEVLKEWSFVYGSKENETYECYSLNNIADIEAKLEKMKSDCGIEYYLTGFSGGVRYQPVVRYNKIHCYIGPEDLNEAIAYMGYKQVDSGSNIALIVPYDECILKDSKKIKDTQVVSPVQIYLDCMNLKGRGEEMAEAVLTKEIKK